MRFLFAVLCFFPMTALASPASEIADSAQDRTRTNVRYDPAYVGMAYPGGDVPADTGVCTDVVIRTYREALGFDFQKAVHEDMKANFSAYPKNWGHTRADKNIDHRRVPNLETYLTRQGVSLGTSKNKDDFKPGDIVSWRLGGRLPHIGIVTDKTARDGTPLIVHNIGSGPKEENILFEYPMTGHFRFHPEGS